MALTRDFKDTIRERISRDAKFRKELLREGVESMVSGNIDTAKTILGDYINTIVGFTELAAKTQIPRADNLFEVGYFSTDITEPQRIGYAGNHG